MSWYVIYIVLKFLCSSFDSALPKIIKTGFSAINLIYFFTAGPDEVTRLHTSFRTARSCLQIYINVSFHWLDDTVLSKFFHTNIIMYTYDLLLEFKIKFTAIAVTL